MKKIFTLFAACTLVAASAFAQPFQKNGGFNFAPSTGKMELPAAEKITDLTCNTSLANVPMRAAGEIQKAEAVTLPAGVTAETYNAVFNKGNSNESGTVQVAVDGDDLYISGLNSYIPSAFVKGTKNATYGYYVFAPGQYFGQYYGYDMYFGGYNSSGTMGNVLVIKDDVSDAYYFYNIVLVNLNNESTFTLGGSGSVAAINYGGSIVYPSSATYTPIAITELPDGVTGKEYTLKGHDYFEDTDITQSVTVAIDGNDVYVKGFSTYFSDSYVKGTKSGNTITFDGNQYLGAYGPFNSSTGYQMALFFFTGYPIGNAIQFTYNETEDTYTMTSSYLAVNRSTTQSLWELYQNISFSSTEEVEATPEAPTISEAASEAAFIQYGYGYVVFDLPITGTGGESLLASKLYYKIYKDIEGTTASLIFDDINYSNVTTMMTEVPATFDDNYDFEVSGTEHTVYLNESDYASWNKVGVQSIYKGLDITHTSDITWYELKAYTGINNIETDAAAKLDGKMYNLSGQQVDSSYKGIILQNGKKFLKK